MNKLVVGNFKMNLETVGQCDRYIADLLAAYKEVKTPLPVVLCPPALYFARFVDAFKNYPFTYGTQDCFWELHGSFTGATSPKTIASLGGQYVILGHSERRTLLGETNVMVAKKAQAAVRAGLTPIVCVGFLEQECDESQSITQQVEAVISALSPETAENVVFAYEPVWAVGQGATTPSSDEIQGVTMIIRKVITKHHGADVAAAVRILYGGSVTAENVHDACTAAQTDGVLLGRATLQPRELLQIAQALCTE